MDLTLEQKKIVVIAIKSTLDSLGFFNEGHRQFVIEDTLNTLEKVGLTQQAEKKGE